MSRAYKENIKNIDFSDLKGVTRISHETEETGKRSDLASPIIINDNTEVKSMVDGKTYTSKRALRRSYRDNGVIEVGNEKPKPKKRVKPKGVRDSIKKAIAQANL